MWGGVGRSVQWSQLAIKGSLNCMIQLFSANCLHKW